MSQTTILIIDDSATIRRLADSHLSQSGYRVVLAPTAEEGLRLADEIRPDLILLDHQLPGTTGKDVCHQLLAHAELRLIPIVVSSTLRKKAYAEYTELSNVVDLLPKPYAPELLKTTVANALDTGKLIVESQSSGTAVPEVIQAMQDTALAGSCTHFSAREMLDFLNNSCKTGVLEVESEKSRVWFFLDGGRIQAVSATGVDSSEIAQALPESLRDLAPLLNFTVGGRFCSEVDGLVQLLDKKVLDPRLLRKLLRHQAAVLTRRCFDSTLREFRFEPDVTVPPIFKRLPLDISLVALLVDGALACPAEQLPEDSAETFYSRRAIRGQNLDRAGLSAQHMKIVGLLNEPQSSDSVAERLHIEADEARRVLHGLCLAELVQADVNQRRQTLVVLDTDQAMAQQLRERFEAGAGEYSAKVVRDRLALQLLLRRSLPDVLVVALDNPEINELVQELQSSGKLEQTLWVGICGEGEAAADENLQLAGTLTRPYSPDQLLSRLDELRAAEAAEPNPQGELAASPGN